MVEQLSPPHDDYFISSNSSRLELRTRVLKHANSFAILDRLGNVEEYGTTELGLFHQDTRFLSHLSVRMSGAGFTPRPLVLLSSAVKDDNAVLFVHLTNPPVEEPDAPVLLQGTVHAMRTQVLWRSFLCDRLRLQNYGDKTTRFTIHVVFRGDFADIFEARGMHRSGRGTLMSPVIDRQSVVFAYKGLDQRLRRTRVAFEVAPSALATQEATFDVELAPQATTTLGWTIACEAEDSNATALPAEEKASFEMPPWLDAAMESRRAELQAARDAEPVLRTSNSQFDEWLDRSLADLHMLATQMPSGPYPYAGVPWFSTPFGRDGIITALQCLWLAPELAAGVLRFLAATQADESDDAKDAEPGKILHETRGGEMAATGEVPFGRYYGSIDSTPLFLMLAGEYFERTADLSLVRELWPHFERAIGWLDRYGDLDGDGFVEYARRTDRGLANQGWKDSHDAVFHADGRMADAPIALCEVQGYVYAARQGAARMARALGDIVRAEALEAQAQALRQRFEEVFWCEELGVYALALDGAKAPCRVASSNAGQVLLSGIASSERAALVTKRLMSEAGYSGWGVRTVASTAARYNPMSYHDGSVWPHDNALIAAGFGRYGMRDEAARILSGLFEASLHFDLSRLPELFCGFSRQPGESPTLYPQACSPQAWAAAAPLMCLQACLGLTVDGARNRVSLSSPTLPRFLDQVHIDGLRLPGGQMDIVVTRHASDVGVRLKRRTGDVGLVVTL